MKFRLRMQIRQLFVSVFEKA